jgi:DNA ligase D-like protein (predicted 3'-phosphoesterase)
MTRFVIQEHYARSHHFDFRLEKDGVFKSWAIPKGIPDLGGERRLAVQVDDHPLAFGGFERAIPKGQYGAGKIEIWDKGVYEASEWSENKIVFQLSGQRTHGEFKMIKFSDPNTAKWLLIRKSPGPK